MDSLPIIAEFSNAHVKITSEPWSSKQNSKKDEGDHTAE
jgi:hypothetical protein